MKDGSYKVSFKVDKECPDVQVNIYYVNEDDENVEIRGGKCTAGFVSGAPAKNNSVDGGALLAWV
jgi:hypothetical protein